MRFSPVPLLLVLISCFQPGHAQFKYGIHTGIGLNTMTDPDFPSQIPSDDYHGTALGFLMGMFGEYELSEKFDVYTEVNFERRGADYIFADDDFTIRFNYISIPVQVKYSFLDKFGVKLGPQINYAVSISSNEPVEIFLNSYEDFDIGINLGVSYDISSRLVLGLRYYHGLRPLNEFIFTEDANDPGNVIKYAKNRNGVIGLQYYLN